ncbi:MAG TPA: universal stress protein [Luteitalea sp.]|nr:universal stress protein [Luteitalea sp.]
MRRSTSILAVSDVELAHPIAFEYGLALARERGAELHVIHPVPPDHPLSYRSAERFNRLVDLRRRAEAAGVAIQVSLRHGEPAEIVAEYADARAVDLVVVGAEARTGWARLAPRSLADAVVRVIRQPTLVLPAAIVDDPHRFERVVVAVDRLEGAGGLIEAATIALGGGARDLTIVHGVDSLAASDAVTIRARWVVPEFRDHVIADARRDLAAAVEPHLDGGVGARLHVAAGPAVETITKAAAEATADLVVVGGSRRFRHWTSVTSRLIRRAELPLLVIPDEAIEAARRASDVARARVA